MSAPGRVPGHALQAAPGPHGESVCECGEMSLATRVNAGRRWHREHKAWVVRAGRSEPAATVRA